MKRFFVDQDFHHLAAALGCFSVMNQGLKRNICDLKRYSTNVDATTAILEERIDMSVRYSCRYWDRHLVLGSHRNVDMQVSTGRIFGEWMNTKLLQWFEVLALLGELGRGVEALNSVREWLTSV